jgi:hypothetical protein
LLAYCLWFSHVNSGASKVRCFILRIIQCYFFMDPLVCIQVATALTHTDFVYFGYCLSFSPENMGPRSRFQKEKDEAEKLRRNYWCT